MTAPLFEKNTELLLVIPPVVRKVNEQIEIEIDFVNNLKLYLRNFQGVTFACPVAPGNSKDSGILKSAPIDQIPDHGRLRFIELPYAYREDRYFRHYMRTLKIIRGEITRAHYLIFSPHAKYDWSTIAALEAIRQGRKYDVESDWDHQSVLNLELAEMKTGINKLRKLYWKHSFLRNVDKCFAYSGVALLQGQDVFEAYKNKAPNPFKVLNVQVSPEDRIPADVLKKKLVRVRQGAPLRICYAGRMIPMKGTSDWMRVIRALHQSGIQLSATWFGDGSLMPELEGLVRDFGLSAVVSLPGVLDRGEIMRRLWETDIFLFCHKTGESPRCLSEALAAGCPLVGYASAFPRDLVSRYGGGEFSPLNDWQGLAEIIKSAAANRDRLADMINCAARSGEFLDRDTAIQYRIDLIKEYLA